MERSGENLTQQYTHEHTWSTEWTRNDTAHWHECLESQCTAATNQEKDGYAEHTFGTPVEQINATCKDTGTAAHYICSGCQTYFTAEQTVTTPDALILPIDPNAHHYGTPDYVWAEDNSTCTATRICSHNSDHREVEVSTAGKQVTQVQDCTHEERTTFTATFTNSAFETQVKEHVKTKDVLGHSYGTPTYVWAEDNSTCTATRICSHNSQHREVEVSQAGKQVTQVQDCTHGELTKYTAAFENAAFSTQVTDSIKTKDALGHDFVSGSIYKAEADGHSKQCARCDQYDVKQAHSGGTATETTQAVCTACGQSYGALLSPTPEDSSTSTEATESRSEIETESEMTPADGSEPTDGEPDGLSAGALIAIVIGSVVLAGAGGFALYWFLLRKKR